MLKALRTAAPDARALDLVGDGDDAARAAALAREAECKRYEDRTVDVVLSCARMNEGTDWPLCAAVYNVRIPGSAQLILQRWARAARGKWGIEGYPEQWRDVQLLRFYVPRLTGDATGDAGAPDATGDAVVASWRDLCARQTACGSCATTSLGAPWQCGWCVGEGRCLPGREGVSLFGCGGGWTTAAAECP
jgi:hypothetical protein